MIDVTTPFYTVYNSYKICINTFKVNLFKILNTNEKPVIYSNTQLIESSQAEPCRSCTDFRTFNRMRRQEYSQTKVNIFFFIIEYFDI